MDSVHHVRVPRKLLSAPFKVAALNSKSAILIFSVLLFGALFGFSQTVRAEAGKSPDSIYSDSEYSALLKFVQDIGGDAPKSVSGEKHSFPDDAYHAALRGSAPSATATEPGATDDTYSTLLEFAQQVGIAEREPAKPEMLKLAAVQNSAGGDATYVGSEKCLTCHSSQAAAFGETLMGRIGKTKKGMMECENCHGPGSAHVKAGGGRGVGGIISFRKDDKTRAPEENNAICLGCHDKGDRLLWQSSTHETRGLACTNCHTVMKNVTRKHQLAMPNVQDTCFQCHKNKRAETWRSSHMPVREGKITCTNCHNPHGSFADSLLRQASVNDNCYQCHAEKRGPFLWEHAPVRENCTNCHDPHGSINDFLLKASRPRLCQQCHSTAGGHPSNPRNPQSVFALNRGCQNCHSQHHGSNSPSGARFQR